MAEIETPVKIPVKTPVEDPKTEPKRILPPEPVCPDQITRIIEPLKEPFLP